MIDRVEIESLLNVTQFNGSTSHWTEVRHQNCRDYDVPGVVVFRGYVWMFCTFLAVYFSLLKKVFFAGGLVRKMCITGTGSFYMEGRRQTCMASSTLISPASEGTESRNHEFQFLSMMALFCDLHLLPRPRRSS